MGPGSFDPGSCGRHARSSQDRQASMGPGSFDPGSVFVKAFPAVGPPPLQWGRGLSTPEVRRSAPRRGALRLLQWGRGLSTPEVRGFGQQLTIYRKLQWGRGLSTPEVREAAAALEHGDIASMGPGSFDPGSDSLALELLDLGAASMGPGSFDPGSYAGSFWPAAPNSLQWGRGLSTPEVPLAERHGQRIVGFNGAGVFRPRKSKREHSLGGTKL